MVKNVLIFAAGAAVGSAVTYKLIKTKYEQIAREEIESVKEVFSRRSEESDEEDEDDEFDYDFEPDQEELKAMNDKVSDLGYTSYSKKKNKKGKHNDDDDDCDIVPYVISPDDFGDTGYETVSLTYYADNVLAYDYDEEVVEDADLLIGSYSLDRIGEYEEDIIHVRNDVNQTDYEICRVNEKYSDVDPTYRATEG